MLLVTEPVLELVERVLKLVRLGGDGKSAEHDDADGQDFAEIDAVQCGCGDGWNSNEHHQYS